MPEQVKQFTAQRRYEDPRLPPLWRIHGRLPREVRNLRRVLWKCGRILLQLLYVPFLWLLKTVYLTVRLPYTIYEHARCQYENRENKKNIVKEFFAESGAPANFVPFLKSLDEGASIVVDAETRVAIDQIGGVIASVINYEDIDSLTVEKSNQVIVASLKHEYHLLPLLREENKKTLKQPILGLLQDVYPYVVSNSNIMNHFDAGLWDPMKAARIAAASDQEAERIPSYCIVCSPRSGSHYFCDLLTSAGIGRPKEHTKKSFIYFLRRRPVIRFDTENWFRQMRLNAADAGIFGTKIVADDLFQILEVEPDYLDRFDFIVHLQREDAVLRAISLLRAKQSDVWHIRKETTTDHVPIKYDFGSLKETYQMFRRQDRRLARIARQVDTKVIKVVYERLIEAPEEEIRRVGYALRCPVENVPQSSEMQIRRQEDYALAERFRAEAREKGLQII